LADRGLLDNLLVLLNGTGLQQKDQKLYQFLKRLLDGAVQVGDKLAIAIDESTLSPTTINNFITHQFLEFGDSDGGGDGISIPGPPGGAGSAGATGAIGPIGPAIYLANDDYMEEMSYLGIPSVSAAGAGTVTSIADDGIYTENTPDPIVTTGTTGLSTLSKSAIDSFLHSGLGGI